MGFLAKIFMTKGFLIAASESGAGKTVTTMALLAAFQRHGYRALAAKCGCDFIDSSYLHCVSKAPVANIDPWMQGLLGIHELLQKIRAYSPDIVLFEGAMGLFDGGESSSAHIAAYLSLPILLLIPASHSAQSLAAVAEGFFVHIKRYLGPLHPPFFGLITTHVASKSHASLLAEALTPLCAEYGCPYLGSLAREGAPKISHRHLGLVAPSLTESAIKDMAAWLERSLCFDTFLCAFPKNNTQNSLDLPKSYFFATHAKRTIFAPKIAIAFDAAFSFCYADLPDLFRFFGAEIVVFSPLNDTKLPVCDGVYFPGGYPELFAKTLSQNKGLKSDLFRCNAAGIPIYAECGGFIFLLESLTLLSGQNYSMVGLLPGMAAMCEKRQGLGYRIGFSKDFPRKGMESVVRGHEYHYARYIPESSEQKGFVPLFTCFSRTGKNLGANGLRKDALAASWLHIHPEGGRAFFAGWVELIKSRISH